MIGFCRFLEDSVGNAAQAMMMHAFSSIDECWRRDDPFTIVITQKKNYLVRRVLMGTLVTSNEHKPKHSSKLHESSPAAVGAEGNPEQAK